ncbi:MAG: hypothetical protein R3273_05760 [Pseudidiomarina maritima]|nr:hypothetical protein [Pseudidiomarina maritima]
MTLPVKSLVLMAMLSLLGASSVNAKSADRKEQPRPDPGAEVIYLVASTIGFSLDELNRSFNVIVGFQSGKFTLPELDSLSDDELLLMIDRSAEPFASLDNQQLMLVAQRYLIETELLAARADVDVDKFRQFYRTFDRTITLALRVNKYVSAKQRSSLSPDASLTYMDVDNFDGPIIACDRSCRAVQEQVWEDMFEQLNIMGDMQSWEEQHGSQPLGTVARIVDHESGKFIEIRNQSSSLAWRSVIDGSDCGAAACI